MQQEALLIGMGQLGAVFAGFIAIILAFVQREVRLKPGDALRTRSILHPSFLVILGATLPLVLHANGIDEAHIWQWSAVSGMAFALTFGIVNLRFHLAMSPEERREAGPAQSLLGWLITLPGYGLTAWVAAGLGGEGLYIAGLGSALLVASWNFITLAGKRWL